LNKHIDNQREREREINTANFDRGFEFEKIGLLDEDVPRGNTELLDLRLGELNKLAWFRRSKRGWHRRKRARGTEGRGRRETLKVEEEREATG